MESDNMASAKLNEESVQKKLMSVTNTQDSIQSLSLWIIHHKSHYNYIVELWYKVMKSSEKSSHRLTLLYLCNDVVQTCKRKKAPIFVSAFKPLLKDATALVRDATIRPKVERIFNVWEERQVYEKDFVAKLRAILDGQQVEEAVFKKPFSPLPKERVKGKSKQKGKQNKKKTAGTSSVTKEPDSEEKEDAAAEKEEKEKEDDTPSEETLAAFKPKELTGQIASYKHQEFEVDFSVQKLALLKLDASSIEAIKHLKDRAHGNEFSTDFEESCLRLEETVESLVKLQEEQKELLAQLHIGEHFYNQQNDEARVVVNAYKLYGARIHNVKKKVDEMLKTLPSPDMSPIPPELFSPASTPPHTPHCDFPDMEDSMTPENNGSDAATMNGVSQVESGPMTSFVPSLPSSMSSSSRSEEERPIPVYTPQPIVSNGTASSRRPSANKTLTESDHAFSDKEGGSTPLTDEPPTTPVMDEEPDSSPSPPPPPPPPLEKRKENPIDFLSRLISQSQKGSAQTKPGVNSGFLASFTRLTNQMKRHLPPAPGEEAVKEEEESGEGSPRPKCWAEWKAEKAASRVEPDTSVPPPPLPLGLPPPALTLPALPMAPRPSLPPRAVEMAPTDTSVPPPDFPASSTPLGVPPPPPLPVSSSPLVPSMSVPPPPFPPGPPSSLAGPSLIIPPPVSPMTSLSIPSLSSPSSLAPQQASPIKSVMVVPPPPASPSSVSPQSMPGAGHPSSPFFEHTSPGQKENWPEAGEGVEDEDRIMHSPTMEYSADMPYPPAGLRMRNNNSVLKELTPSSEEQPLSELAPTSPPPPPPLPPVSDSEAQPSVEEGSAIATLASSPGRGGQGFMDKLNQKHPRGYLPSTYAPNPNLMTLTQGGEEDMDDEDDEEEDEEEEEEETATRIPVLSSVVRRVDPKEKKFSREKDRSSFRDRDSKYSSGKHIAPYPSGSSHRRDRHCSRENNHESYSSSGYSYRERRSYDYDVEDYPPEGPYDDRGYDPHSYGLSSSSRHFSRYDVSQGSSHRSHRH